MVYKPSQTYIDRQLAEVSESERASKRLELDFAHMLVGPTSGHNARRLAEHAAMDPDDLARAMLEAATRYLQRVKE